MSNDEGSASLHQSVHAVLNQLLGTGVDGRGGLIQNQCRRIGDRSPGNGQQLTLALAQIGAITGKHGLIAVRQTADKSVGVGQLSRLDAFFVSGIQLAVTDVIHHRAGEQMGILQHHAQGPAEVRFFDFVDVDAVVADFTVGNVVEPINQVGNGGFTGAGCAHEGDLLARFGVKADVVKDNLVFRITKVHMVQHYAAFQLGIGDRTVRFMGMFPSPQIGAGFRFGELAIFIHLGIDQFHIAFIGFGDLIHQLKHTLCTSRSVDHKVHLLAHLGDGVSKALVQANKGHHSADGDTSQFIDS